MPPPTSETSMGAVLVVVLALTELAGLALLRRNASPPTAHAFVLC